MEKQSPFYKTGVSNSPLNIHKPGGGSPLHATDPKKKKAETIHLDNVDVYGDKLSGSMKMENLTEIQSPHENTPRNYDRQKRRTQKRKDKAGLQMDILQREHERKLIQKTERQERKNVTADVKTLSKDLKRQRKDAKNEIKNKRKK